MSPTLCECCGKNPATIHYTEIKDDQRVELHICEACANEKGLGTSDPLPPMLFDLIQGGRREEADEDLRCPECGITFGEFRMKGRFGCPHDYEVFAEPMGPLLEKIHGASSHTGRLPRGREHVDTAVADHLLRLRRELKDLVRTENYEDAARIRDEIRTLEDSMSGGDD